MVWKSALAAVVAFGMGGMAALYAAGPPLGQGTVQALIITSEPVLLNRADPAARDVGALRFIGGIALRSSNRQFGGLSALAWDAGCKRLLAVSDTGNWLILDPQETAGQLAGIQAAWIAPILDASGLPPRNKRAADAESLALRGDDVFVGFEMDHRLQRYRKVSACRPESLATAATSTHRPQAIAQWPANGGVEAAEASGTRIIMLSEAHPGVSGGRAALRWLPETDQSLPFSYLPPDDRDPTAMSARNPGETSSPMLVLHRHVSLLGGFVAVIAEADFATASEAAPAKARVLARLQAPLTVDNMEGLAVRAEGDRRFVYLISDDNFNRIQQTLLLKFELMDTGEARR